MREKANIIRGGEHDPGTIVLRACKSRSANCSEFRQRAVTAVWTEPRPLRHRIISGSDQA
jgi:hypothetical protein